MALDICFKLFFSKSQKLTVQIALVLLSFSSPLIFCNTSWGQNVTRTNTITQNQAQNQILENVKSSLAEINTELKHFNSQSASSQDKKQIIRNLQKKLENSNKQVRIAALNALSAIGSGAEPALESLRNMLKTERDEEVLYLAILTIRSIGSKPAISELIYVFKNKELDLQVRSRAAEALKTAIEHNDVKEASELIPFLLNLLTDGNVNETRLRISAATVLSGMYYYLNADAVPTLKDALKDPDWQVRRYTITALGNIGVHAKSSVEQLMEVYKKDLNFTVRQQVVIAFGKIGHGSDEEALKILPELRKTLEDKNVNVRGSATDALREVAARLEEGAKSNRINTKDLNSATSELEKSLKIIDKFEQNEKNPLKSKIQNIQSSLEELQRRQAINQILKNPYVWGIGAYLVLLFGIFWLRPLWLLKIDEFLKPLNLKLPIPGGPEISPRFLLFLKHHPRVLDAWVNSHLKSVRESFQQKNTVARREVYISIPVVLDGKTIPQITPKDLHSRFKKQRNCLLIQGEGGVGKTSLACQLAKWAMSDNEEELLCKHRMLPVLLEDNLDLQIMSGIQAINLQGSDIQAIQKIGQQALRSAILGQLQDLTNEPEPISEELLERLLRYRRILVIVDRFSEMSEETRKIIRPDSPNFPVNALVITSRSNEALGNVTKSTVKPLRIEGNRLSSFMEAYLAKQGKRDLFTDTEFFAACGRLSQMVGNRNITVLLAKLYADQITANRVGEVRELPLQTPNNIPNLMLWYLNELNGSVSGDNKLNNRTVQQNAKALAWECLQQTLKPSSIKREVALSAIGRDDAETYLKYLEERLHLIETIGAEQDHIRFALDPLAEYLAALHLIDLYSDNKQSWQQFLQETTAISGAPNTIIDFLLALQDCCFAKSMETKVLVLVAEWLDEQINLSPEKHQSIDRKNPLTKMNFNHISMNTVGVQTVVHHKICNNCSHNNPSNFQFCCKCGKPLAKVMQHIQQGTSTK